MNEFMMDSPCCIYDDVGAANSQSAFRHLTAGETKPRLPALGLERG